jgi:hypothetical protein
MSAMTSPRSDPYLAQLSETALFASVVFLGVPTVTAFYLASWPYFSLSRCG